MVQPGCTGSATLSEKTSRWGTSAKLVSPCTVSGRTVSGTKAALCVRQADGGVAHPHGTVGIIIAEFYIDGAAGKIVGGEDAHGARGVCKGCAEISVCATAKVHTRRGIGGLLVIV